MYLSVLPLGLCQLYRLLMEEWVVQPAYDISIPQGEFKETECEFSVSPIGSSPDNSSGWVLSSNVSLAASYSISSITYIL